MAWKTSINNAASYFLLILLPAFFSFFSFFFAIMYRIDLFENSLMGVQSKQIFEFDSYELDKTFADFDNFVLIKIKSIPPESLR